MAFSGDHSAIVFQFFDPICKLLAMQIFGFASVNFEAET